jgi:hypothetical protein
MSLFEKPSVEAGVRSVSVLPLDLKNNIGETHLMKLISSTIAVITVCFVATSAFGQGEKPGARKGQFAPEKVLHDKDADGDGKISLEEWKKGKKDSAKAEASFKKIDSNKDGFISLEELARGKRAKGAKGGGEAKKEGTESKKSDEPATENES